MTVVKNSRVWRLLNECAAVTPAYCRFFKQAVNESCYQGDDSVLKSLVEIADTAPKYLRPNLEATLQLCLKVGHRPHCYWLSSVFITLTNVLCRLASAVC